MVRIFNIALSISGLFLLSPLLLIIGMMLLFKNGSPIIFKQIRTGKNCKKFFFYKFRTMINEKDKNGNLLPDEKRVTKLGAYIRKSSLDELPSLFNVLKGEMNFVGPRPLLPEYVPLYSKKQNKRHLIKPGITGWAQINGRNSISWEKKFELDVWYVNNRTFFLDLKILFLTVYKVIKAEGINSNSEKFMPRFKGRDR